MITAISLKRRMISGSVLFLVLVSFPFSLSAYNFVGWGHGASGHEYAIRDAMDQEKPVVVYFHTSWCKWSRVMNDQYLASSEIDSFLWNIPRVEINPDSGPAEAALKARYGVTGYPSMLVYVPAFNSAGPKLHPFKDHAQLSASQFLIILRTTIANQYNRQGYILYKEQKYEKAIKYFTMASGYDPKNVYSYYMNGLVQHTIGYNNKDQELLKEAEKNYLKALDIDPNHGDCKKNLEKIRRIIK